MIAAGDSVTVKKPAPDVFLAALGDLRLQPRDCLAIEAISKSAFARRHVVGLATLVTPSYYSRGENFTGAGRVVETLQALMGMPRTVTAGAPSSSDLVNAVRVVHRDAIISAAPAALIAPAAE